MQNHARVVDGIVVETFETDQDIGTLFPPHYFVSCPAGVAQGWTHDGSSFAAPQPPAPPPRYVPLATIRERVSATGRWAAFSTALDGLPPDKRWHLLTLSEGVAPDDADAVALLTAIGCDPAEVLA